MREQGAKNGLPQHIVRRDEAFAIFGHLLSIMDIRKVRAIANAPPVFVLDLFAVNYEVELRLDNQVTDLPSSPKIVKLITPGGFLFAIVLVAVRAVRFLRAVFVSAEAVGVTRHAACPLPCCPERLA